LIYFLISLKKNL